MKVYWAETDSGQKMEWPKGLRVVSLGEHDDLQKALWKYGKHLSSCRLQREQGPLDGWCDCGWNRIRETLSPPAKPGADGA